MTLTLERNENRTTSATHTLPLSATLEALEASAILSDEILLESLVGQFTQAQGLLRQAKEIERILRDELAGRMRSKGATRILLPGCEVALQEKTARKFDGAVLETLRRHLDEETFEGLREVKISYKWEALKKVSRLGGDITSIIQEATQEEKQAPTITVKARS